MLQQIKKIILPATLAIALSGCASINQHSKTCSCPVTPTDKDSIITANVEKSLIQHNPNVAGNSIVQTRNGVVLLSGFVRNKSEEVAAVKTAAKVPGVKQVKTYFVSKY